MDKSSDILRIAGTAKYSDNEGPGLRYTVFLQGCSRNCEGCHNMDSHDYDGGTAVSADKILQEIEALEYLQGVTFSGGEPLDQTAALVPLLARLKQKGYHICLYTGYTYEEIIADTVKLEAIKLTDLLIDGPYIQSKRSVSLKYRGSENQRLIDVQKSLANNCIEMF
jgi:anaerobic ribonucleoside-triphosphate reductase activating protein